MKSRVKFSTFSLALTLIFIGAMTVGCIVSFDDKPAFYCLLFILLVPICVALFYAPLSINADVQDITVNSALRHLKIPMSSVESAELFQPTMGTIRVCASGGFMGYWGIFREGDIGRYVAYYGKSSDCFLVRLKDGRKYILGCENPDAMVSYITSQIR